jgi:hypothetical protein
VFFDELKSPHAMIFDLQGEHLMPGLSFTEGPCQESHNKMKSGQSQNCHAVLRSMATEPHQTHPSHSNIVSLVMKGAQRQVIKFVVEKSMKGVEMIDSLNNDYGGETLQRTHVHYWIKEGKSGTHDCSNISSSGRASNEGLVHCVGKVLKEDFHLSATNIVKALNI